MNHNINIIPIILAAGKGTRMKSAIPKPLHKVGGLAMLEHVIISAEKLGNLSSGAVVVSNESKSAIDEILQNYSNYTTILQTEQLGTGHAVKTVIDNMIGINNESIALIMYADTPLIKPESLEAMINQITHQGKIGAFLTFHTSNLSNKYGRIILDDNNDISQIIEYKDANYEIRSNSLCNSGIIAMKMATLVNLVNKIDNKNAASEYYLTDICKINQSEKLGNISSILCDEADTMGVNSRYELSLVENEFQKRKRIEAMDGGVTMIDPNSVYFSYDTKIESDVIIEPNVIFKEGVKIESGAKILANSYLDNCIIKSGASVGPFARIRTGAIISENASIGNFVEIKKSTIGSKTKIMHLSYIGDSNVGEKTNIGAGTITCNYDGFQKYNTNIGSGTFIGSNSIIVAPVNIGNNAIVAANTTLTKDVMDDEIAISRPEQRNIKDGAKRFRAKKLSEKINQ